MISIQDFRTAKGLDPVANAFAGTVRSDVVNISEQQKLFFFIHKGVGASGTSTITVSACDDNSPSNETAVAFRYRRVNNSDVPGSVTEAAAAGFTTIAGSSDLYVIEVDTKALASSGYKYACLKMVEVVASAVVGEILILTVPRYSESAAAITT